MIPVAAALILATLVRAEPAMEEAGPPFGPLPLLDAIECGDPHDAHPFRESEPPASRIVRILNRSCRVVGPSRKPGYFAYRIGEGRGLVARHAYLLEIDYPEDAPRTLVVVNRGAESSAGIHTGATLGDALWSGGNTNAESLSTLPLAGAYRTCRYLFFLNDHTVDLVVDPKRAERPLTPADGCWVAILHPARADDPLSQGAAAARIRLFDVPEVASLYAGPRYPPEGVPHRHLFVRDGGGGGQGMDNMDAGLECRAQALRVLGINTWCQDLLTAGRNRGWEAENDEWFAPAADPLMWEKALQMVERYGLDVLPYFEYAGSLTLNAAVKARTLKRGPGRPYTDLAQGEPFHLDVTDPRSLEDVRAVLDHTMVRYKDQARFVGAWFRTALAQMPVSFSDACLERFANQVNGGLAVTREQIAVDPLVRGRYGEWWLGQRRDFFAGIGEYLRARVGPAQAVLFTPWAGASGPSWPGRFTQVVTDDPGPWDGQLDSGRGPVARTARWATVVAEDRHLKGAIAWPEVSGDSELRFAAPRADPEHWRETPGLFLTYPFSRRYAVESATAFEAFRGADGLAAVRFHPRNEGIDGGLLGGVAPDMERSGPFCMLEEAHALANGDPVMLGSLAGDVSTRAFPEYVRRFNAAYLALPALPSSRLMDACPDREIVVRSIRVEGKGTWLAVVNLGFADKPAVAITLPEDGTVTDSVTGADLTWSVSRTGQQARLTLAMGPCELKAIRLQPK